MRTINCFEFKEKREYPTVFRPKNKVKFLSRKPESKIIRYLVIFILFAILGSFVYVLVNLFNIVQEPMIFTSIVLAEPRNAGNSSEIEKESIPGEVKEVTDKPKVEILTAEFSAYTSEVGQTDSTPYETADGTDLKTHKACVVAVNGYKFGTKLDIEGIGVCEVHDRMNKRYGKENIDIYMGDDKPKALKFGRKNLNYTII
jgi:3D (Asp-Asp-Asp) domain-containing protein